MNNKVLTLLGFAAKAGALSYGMDAAVGSAVSHKSYLMITACDISDKSKKEVAFFSNKNNVKQIVLSEINIKAISDAVGRKCGIISVNDSGFAESVFKAASYEGGNANDQ